ncbi:glutamate--tRNA ligase, partial [Streptomyces sp. NPDC035033]
PVLAPVPLWLGHGVLAVRPPVGEQHGLKLGKAQAPVRVAVTGRTIGLPLFESMELLGRDRVLARLDAAGERLAAGRK